MCIFSQQVLAKWSTDVNQVRVHHLKIISSIYLMVIRLKLPEISYLEGFAFFVKISIFQMPEFLQSSPAYNW